MDQITAEIVAHSKNEQGDELISVLCTFPRIILAEVNTHRMLSKNTSSSRAIPFNKMVEAVQNNPFIPIAWQKEHKGMQGSEYLIDVKDIADAQSVWLNARDEAIIQAEMLSKNEGVTKQLCNRLLEPFMWTTMLITGSKEGWDNFFSLRCPSYSISNLIDGDDRVFKSKKDFLKELDYNPIFPDTNLDWLSLNKGQAEIHMMDLSEKIYDAVNESFHTQILPTMWHVPFRKKINELYPEVENDSEDIVKISVSMAARASYTVVGTEKILTKEEHISLHDRLLTQDPPHSSPMEHCARAMSSEEYRIFIKGEIRYRDIEIQEEYEDGQSSSIGSEEAVIPYDTEGWCRNFKGFIPYRHIIETEKYGDI